MQAVFGSPEGGAFRRPGTGTSDASSSFHAFLSRQNKMETDKRRHIEAMQASQKQSGLFADHDSVRGSRQGFFETSRVRSGRP